MIRAIALVFLCSVLLADEGNLAENVIRVDQELVVSAGASIEIKRTSSSSVQQIQWGLAAGTFDPTAIGGWTLGTDASNRMVLQAGQGGSVLLDVLHVDDSGNITVPGVLNGAGLSVSGTATVAGTLVASATVRMSGLTSGSGTLTPICLGSLNNLYTCAGSGVITGSGTAGTIPVFTGAGTVGNSDITDAGGVVTVGVADLKTQEIETNGGIQVAGAWTAAGWVGAGAEIGMNTGNAHFLGYDRTLAAYIPTFVNGSILALNSLSGGNVGVGTASPAYPLDVNGTGRFSGGIIVSPGSSVEMLRTSSASVQQIQWGLTGTFDPTAVGGWTLGTDASNRMVLQAGQGGSVLLDVFHVDASGNITVPGVLNGAGLSVSGTATVAGTLVASSTVRMSGLTAGSGTLAPICLGSLNNLYTCAGAGVITGSGSAGTIPVFTGAGTVGNSDITDSGGAITLGGGTFDPSDVLAVYQIANNQLGIQTLLDGHSLSGYPYGGGNNVLILQPLAGLVGIGKYPAMALDVLGSGQVSVDFSAGGNILANGYLGAVSGLQIGGVTVINSSQDATFTGSLSANGITSLGGMSSGGNITASSGGYVKSSGGFYEGSTQVLDTSRNLINIGNLTMAGTVSAGYLALSGAFTNVTLNDTAATPTTGGLVRLSGSGSGSYAYQINTASAADFSSVINAYIISSNGDTAFATQVSAGGSILANGYLGTASGLQIGGVTVIDSSQDASFAGSLSANGITSLGGMSAAGNITASSGGYVKSAGGFYEGSSQILDTSRNLINIAGLTMSGLLDLGTSTGIRQLVYGASGSSGYQAGLGVNLGSAPNSISLFMGGASGANLDIVSPDQTTWPYSTFTSRLTVSNTGLVSVANNLSVGSGISAGGTITANGTIGTAAGYQVGGVTVIDSSQNASFTGSLSANGITSLGGMSAAGNITASSGGYVKSVGGFYEGSTQVLDTSENLINIASLTMSGSATITGSLSANGVTSLGGMSAAGNITASSGGFVKSAGGFYEGATQVLDTSENLINIASLTMSGSATITGSLSANGITSLGGMSAAGNITASSGGFVKSSGGFYEGSTQVLDTSENLINIASLTMSGTVTAQYVTLTGSATNTLNISSGGIVVGGMITGGSILTSGGITNQGPSSNIIAANGSGAEVILHGSGTIFANGVPSSAGSGGLYVCIDSSGNFYKKSSCP